MARHEWIRIALKRKGLDQRDLAKALGSHETAVSRFINHGEQVPDAAGMIAMARLLGMTLGSVVACTAAAMAR